MEISIDDLLTGKATKIRNKEYLPTEAYVAPFLEHMSRYTNDFRAQVILPSQMTLSEDRSEDQTFNRVYLQAVLPEQYSIGDNPHQEVIGLVYGLDVRKPIAKIFKGGLNMACTNLCVFDPQALQIQELSPESPINFGFVDAVMSLTDQVQQKLQLMANTDFDTSYEGINEELGKWIRNSMRFYHDNGFQKVKLSTETPINAYKLLFEKEDSPYYVGQDNHTTMFNVYNAFTQINTDNRKKDIFNEFEKTMLVGNILGL